LALKAVFFDQDGVLIDTERDGHRVAYNEAFHQEGFDFHWNLDRYGDLLKVTGGKERLELFFREENLFAGKDELQIQEIITRIHERKTRIFIDLIRREKMPLRSGILRLMKEAQEAGLSIGICTASDERAARTIAGTMLPDIEFDFILAGDMVKNKKPDPEIYLTALRLTNCTPDQCLVVEDSEKGLQAAQGAGIRAIATTTMFTQNEDLSAADIVVSRLGDPWGKKAELLSAKKDFVFDGVVRLEHLIAYFSGK
jgi:HAD superfamily hydrolase (TIGR01509 family)